jgi:putative DNA primase/helicase
MEDRTWFDWEAEPDKNEPREPRVAPDEPEPLRRDLALKGEALNAQAAADKAAADRMAVEAGMPDGYLRFIGAAGSWDGVPESEPMPLLEAWRRECARRQEERELRGKRGPSPLRTLSGVEPESVEWLWRERVPLGAVSVLAGIGGLGKSHATLAIAAEATRGELTGRQEDVVLMTAEDALAAVVRPRAEAAGADLDFLHVLTDEAEVWLPGGLPALEWALTETGARLLIVDPLVAYLGEGTDSHRDADVRRVLRPLAEMAERLGVAVLVVMHFKKGGETDLLYRLSGSVGFGNAARSVLAVARDPGSPEDPDARVLVHLKSNYGRTRPGLRFRLEPVGRGEYARVAWGGEDPALTPEAAFPAGRPGPDADKRDLAADWLQDALADGPVAVAELQAGAREAGHSWRTVKRAKAELGVVAEPVREGSAIRGWLWRAPESG